MTDYRINLYRGIQHSFENSSGGISLEANKDGIILKFRSVNCLTIIRPLKQLSKVSTVLLSRIFVLKFFCKFLSKHLWRSLHVVKFPASSIFSWTPLDGCVWNMRIIHMWIINYLQCKSLIAKTFDRITAQMSAI